MGTYRARGLPALLAGSLLFGATVVASVFAGSLLTASPASAQGTWAQATEITAPANAGTNPDASLNEVSCWSATNCTAIGGYTDSSGNRQAMAASETSGTWAQATEITAPANAGTDPGDSLSGVSCSSSENCTATGSYTDSSGNSQAMAATETLGTWAQATEVTAPANAVASSLFSPSLSGVSCSSAGNCTATRSYPDTSGYPHPMAATETSGSWAQATEITAPATASGATLSGVSCSSAGNCTTAGAYYDLSAPGNGQAMVATETSGTWAQAIEITAPVNASTTYSQFSLSGVSCWSTGNCTAAGFYQDSSGNLQPMAATETSGTWAQAIEITAPANGWTEPDADLEQVSCSSGGNCTADGFYEDSSDNQQAIAVTETSGNWAQATEVTAPANVGTDPAGAVLIGVSCWSAGNCSATGSYTDSSGNSQAMAATETENAIDTVAFNSDVGAAVASISGPDGSSITLPYDNYPGYVFNGWFTQASGGTEVGTGGSSYTVPVGGITLFAQWTENTIDTVAFNSDGGAAVASISGPDGSSITLPSDTYPGFVFNGWFTAASGGTEVGVAGSSYTIAAGGVTLFAKWASPPPPTTWTQLSPATSPPARDFASMAYDPATGQMVLFGGMGIGGSYLDDTWTWNGTTWTQQYPATSPSARDGASMAYDPATGQMVLFGGDAVSSSNLDDTWTWNGTTWTQLSPATSPPARAGASHGL